MKKRIKEGLDEGTHVSPEVYDLLAKTTNWFAEKLVENTIMCFEKSDNNRMTRYHVIEGYFYHMVTAVSLDTGTSDKDKLHGLKEDD
jgi:hypothetical protein